ncbi:uncharacterized protein LOC104879016 [Vitis vinifera]|uniref:uncharacterized protein LOC104879016 n=1 Tax=Vitis vinifera TaxID=29760 RepID=UPI00053F4266|nr:uncharacterized protein LOC104879016 [Vitis vinifera]|eukprot:XP_010648607.1 PREDICTED: uncharacterized protein LOC104879016 [Vitis vinifera]
MIYPGRRVTVIENETEQQVELTVTLFPTHRVHKRISIAPGTSTEVAATGFCYAPSNPDRPPMISVSVDGSSSGKLLTRRHFITYGKIIVARGPDGGLLISGVKARWTDLGRIKGFGCIFGRSYDGNRGSDIIG